MSSITLPDAHRQNEVAELKAHHLACTQLVRGCQDAIFRFRSQAGGGIVSDDVSYRTIEIMEGILDSWCETVSILRSALDRDSSRDQSYGYRPDAYSDPVAQDSAQMIGRFVKSVFARTGNEREHASRS
jgi:hypothetical protein